MKKGVLGFFVGILLLAVGFCLTVLIMGSIHNNNFVDEIKSWGDKKETVEDVVEDKDATAETDVKNVSLSYEDENNNIVSFELAA